MTRAIGKTEREAAEQRESFEEVESTPPMTAAPVAPLTISQTRLSWQSGGKRIDLNLEALLDGEAQSTVGLLLYGIILKLHDLDVTMRRAVDISEAQISKAGDRVADVDGILGKLFASMKEMGVDLPFDLESLLAGKPKVEGRNEAGEITP